MDAIHILWETPGAVVCVKPRGILSQSGRPGEESMVSVLERQLDSSVYPVHRLDREVGGVMVYARSARCAADLSRQIQQNQMEKEYLAVLCGRPQQDSGLLTDLLFHDRARNKTYVVERPRKGVKEARLVYQVLAEQDEKTLVQVRLLTGRTHQIRVQFASRGTPLLGDGRYGGGRGGAALWSVRLRFFHQGQQQFICLPESLGPFSVFPPLAELK